MPYLLYGHDFWATPSDFGKQIEYSSATCLCERILHTPTVWATTRSRSSVNLAERAREGIGPVKVVRNDGTVMQLDTPECTTRRTLRSRWTFNVRPPKLAAVAFG